MNNEKSNDYENIIDQLINPRDVETLRMLQDSPLGTEDSASLISLSLKLTPQLLNTVESLQNVLELADEFEKEGMSPEQANRIREAVLNQDIENSTKTESSDTEENVIYLDTASHSDLIFLANSGPGMPNVSVVNELIKYLENNIRVWTLKNPEGIVIGAVSLVETNNNDWTTTTFVRAAFHTPDLSKRIKEAARKAVQELGKKYIVLVNPDNQKAINSMSKVWATADVVQLMDGTLAYSYSGDFEPDSWDKNAYDTFSHHLSNIL